MAHSIKSCVSSEWDIHYDTIDVHACMHACMHVGIHDIVLYIIIAIA